MLNAIMENLRGKNVIYGGKAFNPKSEEMSAIGPLHPLYYSGFAGLKYEESELEKIVIKRRGSFGADVDTSNFVSARNIDQDEAERLCRCEFNTVGFRSASLLKDINGVEVVEVVTDYGAIMPITFPEEQSLAGIFTNAEGVTAYVMAGRCYVANSRVYVPSINQEAIDEFANLGKDNRTKLSKILSNKIWQLGELEEGEIKKEKAIMWLSYCEYGKFPRMKDGTFYNTVWNENVEVSLYDIVQETNLQKYIRYSSLSQNGETAQAGPALRDQEGRIIIGEVKQFKGTKGKLDISATRGPKQYKQSNYKKRSLVVLSEITAPNTELPMNCMGNCLVTKAAFDNYVTDMTRDLSVERRCPYPAHKIFIETNEEVVRVKGAASFLEMDAILEDGTIEDHIVVLPPREINIKGKMEVDMDKFKYLCQYRDKDSRLQMIKLRVFDQELTVPALYCDIYEDTEHSALSTSSIKPQNIFYYGGLMALYQMNGIKGLTAALSEMLDHRKLSNAMNSCGIKKCGIAKESLDDFINKL